MYAGVSSQSLVELSEVMETSLHLRLNTFFYDETGLLCSSKDRVDYSEGIIVKEFKR